jgi:hypothetical protein
MRCLLWFNHKIICSGGSIGRSESDREGGDVMVNGKLNSIVAWKEVETAAELQVPRLKIQ